MKGKRRTNSPECKDDVGEDFDEGKDPERDPKHHPSRLHQQSGSS
jgi:hypothetical protein